MVLDIYSIIFVLLAWKLLLDYHPVLLQKQMFKLSNKGFVLAVFEA